MLVAVVVALVGATAVPATAARPAADAPAAAAVGEWEALGGLVTSDPAVAPDLDDPSGVVAFVRGSDGGLYWSRRAGGTWSSGAAGGFITSNPVAVLDRDGVSGPPGVYVFARGGDGGLYGGRFSGGTWHGWESLGGYLDADPAATVDSGGLWVAVRGGDGGLYSMRRAGGTWTAWQPHGGLILTTPALAADWDGVHALVMGGDSGLYTRPLTGGGWTELGGTLAAAPAAVTTEAGLLVVVVGPDGTPSARLRHDGAWDPYTVLGGYLTSVPRLGATTDGAPAVARGGDGGLYRTHFDGSSWTQWAGSGGYVFEGTAPGATTDQTDGAEVLVTGGDRGLYTITIAGTPAVAAPLVVADPGLRPAFDPAVHDYVSRCDGSTPVQVTVQAPDGTTVAVDGGSPASGTFTQSVTRDVGRSFSFVTQVGADPAETYYVRCIPADFPTWTIGKWDTPQTEYIVLEGAFAEYAVIVDTHGVPMWWNVVPGLAVFAEPLPDGTFGWIDFDGVAQVTPLDGSDVQTIATGEPGVSYVDNHDMVQLPDDHYLLVLNRIEPDVDLSMWGPSFTTGSVIDHVFVEIDENGDTVWSWDMFDHVPMSATNPQWRGAKGGCGVDLCDDPYHWNSLEVTDDGAIIASFRHLDAVLKIDRTTGDVVWSLGGPAKRTTAADGVTTDTSTTISAADAAFSADDIGSTITDSLGFIPEGTTIETVVSATEATISQPATGTSTADVFTVNPATLTVVDDPVFTGGSHLGGQHDARLLTDGTVSLFDNGTNLGRAPRAVRYDVDETAMTATLVEQVSDPVVAPSSFCCGSTRTLSGGHWVTGWGSTNFVTEMTAAGERVFSLRVSGGPFVYRGVPVEPGVYDRATLRAAMDAKPSDEITSTTNRPQPQRAP